MSQKTKILLLVVFSGAVIIFAIAYRMDFWEGFKAGAAAARQK